MIYIIREISKLSMFTILWLFPIFLARWNENNNYLWFFILSLIVTVGVFSHYEDLERLESHNHFNEEEDGTNE